MLAHFTIKDKQANEDKTYEIALDIKLFADTIKLIFDKYPNLSTEKLKGLYWWIINDRTIFWK